MRGRLTCLAAAAAVLVLAGGAEAQVAQTPPDAKLISQPRWERIPTADDMGSVFPPRALHNHRSGKALMQCSVTKDRTLIDCVIVSETPPDEGFGPAALKLAPKFRMSSTSAAGTSVEGGVVRVTIVFSFNGEEPASPRAPAPDGKAVGPDDKTQASACLDSAGEAAITACTRAIQSGGWSASNLVWAYARRGELNLSLARDEAAIADLTEVLTRDAWNAADYTKAVSLRPDLAALYISRARARHLIGDDANGLADADKAVSMARTNARALEIRAEIYETLGRRDAAIADYRAALKSLPRMSAALDGLKRLNAGN